MVHAIKISGENRGFAPAGPRADFDDGVSIFVFIRGKQADLNFALKVRYPFFQIGNLIVGHCRDVDITGSSKFAIIVQLTPRGFEFTPAPKQFLNASMFAHDFAGMRAVLEQMWVGNLTLELFEAFPLALDKEIKIHNDVAGLYQPPKKPRKRSRLYNNLSFFLGARGFGTAVTAGGECVYARAGDS